MTPLDDLKTYHVQRAKQRTHRPCAVHGPVRHVCESCAKVICPLCPPHTCAAPVARVEVAATSVYKPPRGLLPVWRIVQPLGALDIQPHPDAEAWLIRFPPQSMQAESAGDLANRLWVMPDFIALATTTAFRAGRGSKPTHWWVSFQLKIIEKEQINDGPQTTT